MIDSGRGTDEQSDMWQTGFNCDVHLAFFGFLKNSKSWGDQQKGKMKVC